MAKKEDIFERIRRINPQAPDMIDEIIENLRKHGCDCDAIGFLTEDMTLEEIKMVCLETNLKAGLSLEEARKEAEKDAEIIIKGRTILERSRQIEEEKKKQTILS